jgi:hypothetical protein
MLYLLLCAVLLLAPVAAAGQAYTPAQFADVYSQRVPRPVIATRILALYNTLIPAQKVVAWPLLRGDLETAHQNILDGYQADLVGPLEEEQARVAAMGTP